MATSVQAMQVYSDREPKLGGCKEGSLFWGPR